MAAQQRDGHDPAAPHARPTAWHARIVLAVRDLGLIIKIYSSQNYGDLEKDHWLQGFAGEG